MESIVVTKGNILVEPIAPQESNSGIIEFHEEKPKWARVIKVGEPHVQDYSPMEIKKWEEENIHPFSVKVGDEIMMPKNGKPYTINNKNYQVFWQSDVHLFRSISK